MMSVSMSALPATLEEFEKSPLLSDMTKPEHVCALMLCAFDLFVRDQAAGTAAVNMLRGPRPMTGYDIQFLRDRFRDKAYLPMAYFNGATPANGYTPDRPYTLELTEDPRPQDIEDGYLRVFLRTSGADAPRPVKLRRKGAAWCLWEYSSVLSGIRYPVQDDPWA